MILFKNSADTMDGVLKNAMHATDGRPQNIDKGDIILISQTKSTLLLGQKPIRWIMNFVSCEFDKNNESDKIWGRHWVYIIRGENVRPVEPFDIDEIKVTSKDYGSVQTHCSVEPEDEEVILNWIYEAIDTKTDESNFSAEEFKSGKALNSDELIRELDTKYSNKPEFKEKIVKAIQRPSLLSNAIKKKYGFTCRICGYPGFSKKGGGKYAEVHHMIELNEKAPETLQSWNIIVVCPLCHKKLHFADVKTEFSNPGWKITIEGKEYIIK
jgi:5-methylcytosine-specific restriction protein A